VKDEVHLPVGKPSDAGPHNNKDEKADNGSEAQMLYTKYLGTEMEQTDTTFPSSTPHG
jgi:hypothetical protein